MAGFVHFLELLVPILVVGGGVYAAGRYFYWGQKRADMRMQDETEWDAEARRRFHKESKP